MKWAIKRRTIERRDDLCGKRGPGKSKLPRSSDRGLEIHGNVQAVAPILRQQLAETSEKLKEAKAELARLRASIADHLFQNTLEK